MYKAKDESLRSLLFRITEVYGLYDIQSYLIGHNGHWLLRPLWPKRHINLLDSVSDKELLELVEKSGLNEPLDLFDFPDQLLYGLESVFGDECSSVGQRKGRIPIAFCYSCIHRARKLIDYN